MERNSFLAFTLKAWHSRGQGAALSGICLGFVFLLLVSCTNPIGQQHKLSQQAPTPSGNLSSTPSPSYLTQQYQFTAQDSGRTVTYTITSRFGIILNGQKYPKSKIQLSCLPSGMLGDVSNIPSVAPPLYAVRYEGVRSGVCVVKNGTFHLTVIIVPLSS